MSIQEIVMAFSWTSFIKLKKGTDPKSAQDLKSMEIGYQGEREI